MVGDKTFAFLLMDKEMYFSMTATQPANLIVDRGIALHKVKRSLLSLLRDLVWIFFFFWEPYVRSHW